MCYFIPPGFDGNHYSIAFATDLIADLLNEERWEVDEISDRIFKRIIGRESSRPIDSNTERELFLRLRNSDTEARDTLVFANLRLVNTVARQFKPHKLTCNDIVSEGLVGLLKAIDGFDVDSYNRFSTYAYKTIYYHIQNFLNAYNSAIVYPSSIYSLRSRYIVFYERYFQENISRPSDTQVAEGLYIYPYQAKGVRQCLNKPVSLEHLCDFLGYNFVREELLDDIVDCEPDFFDTSLNFESLLSDIDECLANLSEREADIIRKSFGIGCHPYSLDEIGLKYDITRERARQIREKAIRKLRGKFGRPLKQYLNDYF